jgi:hypothetical protein
VEANWGVEVYLHAFLNMASDGGEYYQAPVALPTRNGYPVPAGRVVGWVPEPILLLKKNKSLVPGRY